MKKRFIPIVAIATIFGLTACGDDSGSNANPSGGTGTGPQDTHSVDSGKSAEGILIDDRDGQKYKTVQIGPQIWMAENLKLDVSDGYCVDDIKANCEKYGVLYTTQASSRVCPEGWKKPSYTDWKILARNAGAECENGLTSNSFVCNGYDAISKIRSTDGWDSTNGTNQLGLSLFPVGYLRSSGNTSSYRSFGKDAFFWEATITESTMSLSLKQASEHKAKPIRCMKELPCERENEGEVLGVTVCDGSKWIEGSEVQLATHLEKCDTTNLGKVINGYTCAMDGMTSWTLTENVVVAPDGYPYIIREKDGIKYIQLRNKLGFVGMTNAFTYEQILTVTCPDGWSFPQDNSLLTSCWTTELIQSCQTSDCSNQLNTSAYCIKN